MRAKRLIAMEDAERQLLGLEHLEKVCTVTFELVRRHSKQVYEQLIDRLVKMPRFAKEPSGCIFFVVDQVEFGKMSAADLQRLQDFCFISDNAATAAAADAIHRSKRPWAITGTSDTTQGLSMRHIFYTVNHIRVIEQLMPDLNNSKKFGRQPCHVLTAIQRWS